jgi:hypothetical protein
MHYVDLYGGQETETTHAVPLMGALTSTVTTVLVDVADPNDTKLVADPETRPPVEKITPPS